MAPFFAFNFDTQIWKLAFNGFISFCLISSSIYLLNDSFDKNLDKLHPFKKFRPIALGSISIKTAIFFAFFILIIGFIIGFKVNIHFFYVLILYFLIQVLYSVYLKNIPLVELFCIASGFILRSISGGIASGILITNWFLLSVWMLALFLALEKRKAEIINNFKTKIVSRRVLKSYSIEFLNKLENVLMTCTIMSYSLWSYGPEIGGAKSKFMVLTIPLVMLGMFRYQLLSNITDKNNLSILESPENVVLRDRPMQLILVSWLLLIAILSLYV